MICHIYRETDTKVIHEFFLCWSRFPLIWRLSAWSVCFGTFRSNTKKDLSPLYHKIYSIFRLMYSLAICHIHTEMDRKVITYPDTFFCGDHVLQSSKLESGLSLTSILMCYPGVHFWCCRCIYWCCCITWIKSWYNTYTRLPSHVKHEAGSFHHFSFLSLTCLTWGHESSNG